MYEKPFGLSRSPFPATAAPVAYYPASTHEEALITLRDAIEGQEGFALLTAQPGMGKTLLAQKLAEELADSGREVLCVANALLADRRALFQAVLYDLGQPYEGRTEQELRLQLTDAVLKSFQGGKPIVLLVDEGHHLSPALLEELRLLGNLEAGVEKAIQVLLVGQPLLGQTLRLPYLRSLHQRLRVRAELAPLDVHEGVDYLVHLLRGAGGKPEKIMTDEALELLARGGHGVPRIMNQAAHRACQLAHAAEQTVVDAEAALEALAEMEETQEAAETVLRRSA